MSLGHSPKGLIIVEMSVEIISQSQASTPRMLVAGRFFCCWSI